MFDIADRVLATCTKGDQEDSKRIAELAMARHYILRFHSAGVSPEDQAESLAVRLLRELHRDSSLMMLTNGFLLQQHITPYVFLRSKTIRSTYYESLLDVFSSTDLAVEECFPYRGLERGHLMYKLGHGPVADAFDAPIFRDALQIFSFNRDLSYALTHTILYSTDFADLRIPDARVKTCCLFLLAQSFPANDIDLFLESCICLQSQEISADEMEDMLAMVRKIQQANTVLFCCNDLSFDYHPLLVHDILRCLVLRRTGRDIWLLEDNETEKGPIQSLINLNEALKGKDIDRIESAYAAHSTRWDVSEFLIQVVQGRLEYLKKLASREVLFEREFAQLGRRDASIYSDYEASLARVAAQISPSADLSNPTSRATPS